MAGDKLEENRILSIVKDQFNKRVYDECVTRIDKVLSLLSEDEIWYRPNKASNSVGHLILHLCGNVTQWIGAGVGGFVDKRERDLEFASTDHISKEALIQRLYALKSITDQALVTVTDEQVLVEARTVQGYQETVLSIIIHVTEHFSYHTGQIALICKHLKGQDLGFYEGVDLNATGD